ncbi:hypothetical protein C3L33_01622, partial [Rhododendron williamsianum]
YHYHCCNPSTMEPPQQPPKPHFSLPVDADHKATEFRLFSLSSPHMLAFHLSWLSLFSNFFSTFSIPPLLSYIRSDLELSSTDIGYGGIASFTGAIFSRLAMGPACDLFGPRIASSTLSLLTAPIVLSVSLIQSSLSFILVRFLIGFCLANFVANQFWMSSMFSSNVVGLANGFAAGWANVGSGATQLLMPLIVSLLTDCFQIPTSTAWRAAFVVPAVFQSVTATLVLIYGQDLPDGNYSSKKNSRKTGGSGNNLFTVLFTGLRNYRGWILGLTYGYCFGVELTTDNIIAEYFYDRLFLSGCDVVRGGCGCGGGDSGEFRVCECRVKAGGRDGVGRDGEEVWDEGEAVEPLGGADGGGLALCFAWEG